MFVHYVFVFMYVHALYTPLVSLHTWKFNTSHLHSYYTLSSEHWIYYILFMCKQENCYNFTKIVKAAAYL